MAKRHFDKQGYPYLREIVKEIRGFVGGFTFEPRNRYEPEGVLVAAPGFRKYCSKERIKVRFRHDVTDHPLKVTGVYVVGGQVEYIKRGTYNTGRHDLDLVVRTNVWDDCFRPAIVEYNVLHDLEAVLNDGKSCWTERETKEFAVEIWHINTSCPEEQLELHAPYVRVYPGKLPEAKPVVKS